MQLLAQADSISVKSDASAVNPFLSAQLLCLSASCCPCAECGCNKYVKHASLSCLQQATIRCTSNKHCQQFLDTFDWLACKLRILLYYANTSERCPSIEKCPRLVHLDLGSHKPFQFEPFAFIKKLASIDFVWRQLTCLGANLYEAYAEKFPNLKYVQTGQMDINSAYTFDLEPNATAQHYLHLTHIVFDYLSKDCL